MAGIAALAFGYVLSQFYRSFLAVLTPALAVDLGMTKAELSVASAAWFVTLKISANTSNLRLAPMGCCHPIRRSS